MFLSSTQVAQLAQQLIAEARSQQEQWLEAAAWAIVRQAQRGSIDVGMGLLGMSLRELESVTRSLGALSMSAYECEQLIKRLFLPVEAGSDRPIVPAPEEIYLECAGQRVAVFLEYSHTYPSRPLLARNSVQLEPLARLILRRALGSIPVTGRYRCPTSLAGVAAFEVVAKGAVPLNKPTDQADLQ